MLDRVSEFTVTMDPGVTNKDSFTLSWSSQSSAYLISESMTLSSSASELGLVAGAEENGIARGFGRATAAARGRCRAAQRWDPEEAEARRRMGTEEAAARRAAAKRAMAKEEAAACEGLLGFSGF